MEERVLIESIKNKKSAFLVFVPAIISFIIGISASMLATNVFSRSHMYDDEWELCCALNVIFCVIAGVCAFVALIFTIGWAKSELTVTSKRVYGIAAFGKRVDLPLDSISSVGTSFLKGIDVATSSGQIRFKFIENNTEIHSVLSDLLVSRQSKSIETDTNQKVEQSDAAKIKEFKELLDIGAITQEEFDAKKKEFLGL